MTSSIVLVLTQPRDLTADLVVGHLADAGVDYARTDLADFPESASITGYNTGAWTGWLNTGHRRIRLEDIGAIYYRRPSPFVLAKTMTPIERSWAQKETRAGVGGLLMALGGAHWINHPHHNTAATKPMQMIAAGDAGLATPRSIITNNPAHAAAFIHSCPNGAIYKTLTGSPHLPGYGIYTSDVTGAGLAELAGVAQAAHLFQERLRKAFEVRLTVIGETMFAARIDVDAASPTGHLDWRSDYPALSYTLIDTPPDIAERVRAMLDALHLRFAAIDFIVTPGDHRWVLVDVNPNGQWGFVEEATGAPIAHTIATDLTQGATR
ncbi:MvdC/MvdD family ATP grasp protein [Phytomonospora sp. NPDC050363]|uniref:MvdC/MvdD family ATP grasp protein n=1 Tax=Phytomonospora sp. NPDC050363 TaxID=3155642 RepID=UPI0033DCA952